MSRQNNRIQNQEQDQDLLEQSNNDYSVYIRRSGPMGWTRGRPHHQQALLLFQEQEEQQERGNHAEEREIRVPHTDGGDFVAWFHRVNQVVYQYRDENGAVVDIMMSSSGHAAYVNRLIDHF